MSNNLQLQLLLKLNDQMSNGLKSAMQTVRRESDGVAKSVAGIASAASRVKPTAIERMTAALRSMHGAAKSSLDMLQKVAQTGAAVAAGGYVLKNATERPMAYDRRLALTANTAYSDRDVAGRIAGKASIDAGVRDAVKRYGGSPEQALETFNALVGSGAMGKRQAGVKSSLAALPLLQQAVTGTGASGDDLAQIYIAAKQNMGMSDSEAGLAISKAIKAGAEGGFEIKSMARWLPQQMAMAGNNGMGGMGGFESLIAANQATRMTAGTADEAGNNLVNLLAKVTSNDTANDLKRQHVDLYDSLTEKMGKGMNSLEAFVGMVQQIGSKDAKYRDLKAKADAAKSDPEKQKLYEGMASIMMAKGVGKTVQDRQALTGLFGMMSPTGKYHDVLKAVKKEQGTEVGNSFGSVSASTDYKAEQLGNRKAFAGMDALSNIQGPLNNFLDGVVSLADAHPKAAAAAYSVATAFGVLAAVSGVAGIFSVLKDGGKAGQLAKGAGSSLLTRLGVTAAFAGGTSLVTLGGLGASGLGAIAGGVGLAGAGGYAVGTGINWGMNKGLSGATGSETSLGSMIYDLLHREQANPQPVKVVVDVKNGNIVASVNDVNARAARRH